MHYPYEIQGYLILSEFDTSSLYLQITELIALIRDSGNEPTVFYQGQTFTVKTVEMVKQSIKSKYAVSLGIAFHLTHEEEPSGVVIGYWVHVWPESTEVLHIFLRELLYQIKKYDEKKLLDDVNEAYKSKMIIQIAGDIVNVHEAIYDKILKLQVPIIYHEEIDEYVRIYF